MPSSPIEDLLDILPDAVLMVDARGDVVYANPAVETLLGHAPADLRGQPLEVLLPPAVRARHAPRMAAYRDDGVPAMMGRRPVLGALHRSGRVVPVSIAICNFDRLPGDRVSVAVLHDVATLHTDLDRATALAETDALTGMANRLALSRRMRGLLEADRPFGLLLLDLTQFKPFNDLHGHAAGDAALRIVGRRLRGQVREGDLVARLGGDEFVLLFDGLDGEAGLASRAQAALASLGRRLRLSDLRQGRLGANIGGALHPRHGRDAQTLLAAADAAMYAAKRAGCGYRLAD